MSNISDTHYHQQHEAFTNKAYMHENILPHKYVFILTNQCNLNCSFCFQNKNKNSTPVTKQEWISLLDSLPSYARVTLTGGEPLLCKDFKDIFLEVTKKFTCNIITNGLLLTDEVIDLLLQQSNFKVLSISIDDPQNTIRNVDIARWKIAQQQIIKFVTKKNKIRPDIIFDIKTNILDQNAHLLFATYQYGKNILQCDTHAFQFLKGSPIQHSDVTYLMKEIYKPVSTPLYKNFNQIKSELLKIAQQSPPKTYIHPKLVDLSPDSNLELLDILNQPHFNLNDFEKCKFPWSSVHINYNGELFPCLAISMGNIKSETLHDIIFGKKFITFKKELKSRGLFPACNRCGWIRLVNK